MIITSRNSADFKLPAGMLGNICPPLE